MTKRVLVVDDDLDFAETLSESFVSRGCEVDIAASGEEAVAMYRDGFYDVAFMDVKLPGKNGVESFLEIRKFSPDARVVMMTGYSMQSLLEQAKVEGAEAIFHKSLDMEHILSFVERLTPKVAVLVVDDDPEFTECTQEILEDAGYDVAVVHDARHALEHIENAVVDILLLDVRLKDNASLHLYQYMHHLDSNIPTIVITGFPAEEAQTINLLKALSVKEILTKPLRPELLLSVLERYASQKKQ